MTDLKARLDRALTAFEPTGDAFERTIDLARRRQRRRRVRDRSLGALVMILALVAVLIPVLQGNGKSPRPTATASPHHRAPRVLFIHVAPDGSRVMATDVSISTTNCVITTTPTCSGPVTTHTPGVQFDYTVSGLHYRETVADNDPRIFDPQAGIMAPLFGSDDPNQPHTDVLLIILHVRPPVAEVRIAPSGPGGAVPLGDEMAPVAGWVAIPVHNTVNLARPEAFNAKGKLLGSSLPFPCC